MLKCFFPKCFKSRKIIKAVSVLSAFMLTCKVFPAFAGEAVMTRIIEDVQPRTSQSVVTGTSQTIRVLAHEDAAVSVKIGSTTIKLSPTSEYTDEDSCWFEGEYDVPSSAADGSKLGDVAVTATLNGSTQTRVGGTLTAVSLDMLEITDNSDAGTVTDGMLTIQNAKAFSGKQITITADYADVFIPSENDRGEDYAAPYYYQMPKGTVDYVVSGPDSNNIYLLASGRKVSAAKSNVTASSGTQGENQVTSIEMSADSECTYLSFKEKWNVPFNIEVEDVNYASSVTNSVSSFEAKKVRIIFDYTTGITNEEISIPSKSCFKSAKVSTQTSSAGVPQCVLELTLKEDAYYGAYASYTSTGKLELKFYNPVSSLKGARIVIDSGHGSYTSSGGLDPGAATAGSTWEYEENYRKATALKEELEARGAEVYLLDTYKTSLSDLYARVDAAIDWEPMVYVSVHHNSSDTNLSARGVEVYYNNPWSVYLAKDVCNNIASAYKTMDYASGAVNRGHKFSEYAVTRVKQFSAILIEYGFLTTPTEYGILTNSANIQKFAEATADGLEAYFAGEK